MSSQFPRCLVQAFRQLGALVVGVLQACFVGTPRLRALDLVCVLPCGVRG
jgi:hypothetical protein